MVIVLKPTPPIVNEPLQPTPNNKPSSKQPLNQPSNHPPNHPTPPVLQEDHFVPVGREDTVRNEILKDGEHFHEEVDEVIGRLEVQHVVLEVLLVHLPQDACQHRCAGFLEGWVGLVFWGGKVSFGYLE